MKSLHPLHGRPQTVTAGDRGKSQTNAQGLLPLVQRADRSRPPQSAPWGRTLAWYPDRGGRGKGEHSIRPWAPSWAELATGGRGANQWLPLGPVSWRRRRVLRGWFIINTVSCLLYMFTFVTTYHFQLCILSSWDTACPLGYGQRTCVGWLNARTFPQDGH